MNRNKLKLIPFLIILICIGAYVYMSHVNIVESHTYTGNVEGEEVMISSDISGELVDIRVVEGDTVDENSMLFQLDVSDFNTKLEQLAIQMDIAQLKYEQLVEGATREDINLSASKKKSVEKKLSGAILKYEHLKSTYEDLRVLYDSGSVSKADLDNSRLSMEQAESNMNSIKAELEAANANLDKVLSGSDEDNIAIAKKEVDLRGLEIKALKEQIDKGAKYSPVKGVVQTVNYNVGENIGPSHPIISIINMDKLTIDIYIEQKNLHKYKVGYKVMIIEDFLEDGQVIGEISSISSKAEFTPKNIESKESKQEMMFKTKVTITKGQEYLRPGMFVDVDILSPVK